MAALLIPAEIGDAQGTPSASPSTAKICRVTVPGPMVFNAGNYGNADLRVDLYPNGVIVFTSENGGLPSGPYSIKFPWNRWGYGEFSITGRRLDAPAPPLSAAIPSVGYSKTHGFIPAGLIFPTLGCWEVTGRLGNASLTFVTIVIAPGLETATATPTS